MWPKALAQLMEVAPHLTRLIPAADRFLQSRSAGEASTRAVLEEHATAMRAEVQGAVGQVTASHAGLYRQMNEQGERVAQMQAEVRSMHASVEALDAHLLRTERALRLQRMLLLAVMAVLVAVMVVVFLRT